MATTLCLVRIWWYALSLVVYNMRHIAVLSSGTEQEIVFGYIAGDRDSRAGVEKAVKDVNRRSDLLPNFTLKPISLLVDPVDECNEASVLTDLFRLLYNSSHRMIALIGSSCSSNEATAKISGYHNITLISCAPTSNELSDHVRFPYYFQLLPSEVNLAHVFYSIIKEYGWRRVGLMVQNEHRYRRTMELLKFISANKTSDKPIEYIEEGFNTEDGLTSVKSSLFNSQVRIIVIAMDSKFARQLLCMAYRYNMKYPKYLFITYGTYETQWWRVEDVEMCTAEQRATGLQFSLAALHYGQLLGDTTAEACQLDSSSSYYYQLCYDAVLALALALNKTIEELNTNQVINSRALEQAGIQISDSFEITNFNYNVSAVTKLLKMHLEHTHFDGESGPIRFDSNGIRKVTDMRVLQYRTTYINGTPILDQTFSSCNISSRSTLDQTLKSIDVAFVRDKYSGLEFPQHYTRYDIWPGYYPHDGVATDKASIILPVAVLLILFDIVGLVFAIVCLVFNLLYRNKKLIRLSSPNLNYLIITGTILVYSSGISFALPLRSALAVSTFCFLRTWLLAFGFTCGFAPIVAKMWRVYYIFRNPQATKRKSGIQDWHLILFVFSLLLMNATIMVLHVLLEGFVANFNVAEIPNKEIPSTIEGELEIQVNYEVYQCSSHLWIRYFVLALIYGYMSVIQICALYFAFQTRKVKVKGLNDAKYIALIVYIVGIMVLINLVTTFTLSEYVTVYAAVYGTFIWMSATVVLGLTFIPKMVRLFKDPNGETVFTAHEGALQITTVIRGHHPQLNEELASLRKKVKQLEDTIVEYKRITGVTLTKQNRLTTSVSMLHLCASNYAKGRSREIGGQRNLFQCNDNSNNCEANLENVLYTDSD